MEPFERGEKTDTLHLTLWEKNFPGLTAGFTLRTGGVSKAPFSSWNLGLHVGDDPQCVIANRKKLAEGLGFPFERFTCAQQVHGVKVARVTEKEAGAGNDSTEHAIEETDGLHTDQSGVLLSSYYADCVPLLFVDPVKRAVGLAHAGWKGTVGRIAARMVQDFGHRYGSDPGDLHVAIGPSIGACCYEVDEHVMREVRRSVPDWETCAKPSHRAERYMLDLPACNRRILESMGINAGQILQSSYCTSCRTDIFFSHRAENGKTGRMASFIGWKEGEA